jgi:hypothetical protein
MLHKKLILNKVSDGKSIFTGRIYATNITTNKVFGPTLDFFLYLSNNKDELANDDSLNSEGGPFSIGFGRDKDSKSDFKPDSKKFLPHFDYYLLVSSFPISDETVDAYFERQA